MANFLKHALITALTATLLAAASCHTGVHADASADGGTVTDSEVYMMGQEAARAMLLQCSTIEEVEQQLLDVRARLHNINSRVGSRAAADYKKGFETYIKQNNDTLYALIKGE